MDIQLYLNDYTVSDNTYSHKRSKPYEIRWNLSNHMKEFWTMYCELIEHITVNELDSHPSIMEKGSNVTPINVTMTFKYNTDTTLVIDNNFLALLIYIIQSTIREVYEVPHNESYQILTTCFSQSDGVYQDESGDYCNTISFIFPRCVVPTTSQLDIFRSKLINSLLNASILRHIPQPKNGNLDDIVSKNPPKGDWTLFGSTSNTIGTVMEIKGWYGELPMAGQFNILDYYIDYGTCPYLSPSLHNDCTRFNFDPIAINDDPYHWLPMVLSVDYCNRRIKVRNRQEDINTRTLEADVIDCDISIAEKLIPLIGRRTESEWLTIGRALYNCVYSPIFPYYGVDFNMNEDKAKNIWLQAVVQRGYDGNAMLYHWYSFAVENNYTLRSIGWFARYDSPKVYGSWHRSWYQKSIENSMDRSSREHSCFSESFFKFYWLEFAYSEDLGGKVVYKTWYKFSYHRWVPIGETETARALDVFRREVELAGKELHNKLSQEHDINAKEILSNKIKRFGDISSNYSNGPWRRNIIDASRTLFYIRDFERKTNINKCLTGVLNGVIEVNDKFAIFREGRPEDYITKFTPVQYIDLGENHPDAIAYMNFMRQLFPDYELCDEMLKFNSSLLQGVQFKYLYIWTGGGDNGKSTYARLLNAALGDDYITTVTSTFITRAKASSSSPTPEIADMKAARLVITQEPDDGESLQPSVIKEATGGDKVRARKLNDNGGPFIPTYQFVMQCNDIPEAQKQGALQSRFRIIPFLSKFMDESKMPDPDTCMRNNIFKKDPRFMDNVSSLATACLFYMVKYYEKFRADPVNHVPKIVQEHTDKYWKSVDKFYQYINERLRWCYTDSVPNEPFYNPYEPFTKDISRTVNTNAILPTMEVYRDYSNWVRDTGRYDPKDKYTSYVKVVEQLSKFLGEPGLDGWAGIIPREIQVRY